MNKILSSELKNFKEWCCGKNLELGFLCGDFYSNTQNIICDDCLMNLKVRKAKIESIRKELIQLKYSQATSQTAMFIGYKKMDDALAEQIKRLQDGRN